MTMWTNWLIAFVVAVLLGLAASFYLRKIRLPQLERAAGIASLTELRWRAFIKIALEALAKRGYSLVGDEGNDGDYLLARDGGQWLLSSRHGGSSRIDSHALAEFAKDIQMRGADGGLVVSPGAFIPRIVREAKLQYIELLDGPTLWPELQPLLPEGQYEAAAEPARIQTRQYVLLAWLGALVVGIVLAWVLAPTDAASSATAPVTITAQTARPAVSDIAMPANTAAEQARANSAKEVANTYSAPAPTDTAELVKRRREVIQLVSTLPHVDRAIWSTQSTLLVYLLDDKTNPVPELCPILEHYDELRTSRLQLQPPQGSSKPVRFLQCRNN